MTVAIREPAAWERRLAGGLVRRLLYPRRPLSPHIPTSDRLAPRVRFTASDGARLVGIHHPAHDPQGIVVLAHPDKRTAKHWWTRQGIPAWLNAHGLDAFAFDFSVYGESRGGNVYLHEHVLAAVRTAETLQPHLPVHLWGVSIGSYAVLNAAPRLPRLESLVAESPYPTFRQWYEASGKRLPAQIVRLLERTFPDTYARIDAARNVQVLETPAILLAASRTDPVTPAALTRRLAEAAPPHTRYVEIDDAPHLGLFRASPAYREAILETFGVQRRGTTSSTESPLSTESPPAVAVAPRSPSRKSQA